MLVLDGGRIGLVDFGLVGKLTDEDMARLTRLFIDAATENVDALPRRLAELGVRYRRSEDEFAASLRELFYRYYGASLADIDPIQVIREGFALIYSMNLRLPTRFVLLDKAIATLGAVGVELYPAFNVFEVARPYARELMLERFSPTARGRAQKRGRELFEIANELPTRCTTCCRRSRRPDRGRLRAQGLDEFMHKLDVVFNRLVSRSSSPAACSASLIGILATDGPQIFGIHFLSVIGFIMSGVLGAWLLIGAAARADLGPDRLDRAADGEPRLRAAGDDVDAAAGGDDAEPVARGRQVGEALPALRPQLVRVDRPDRALRPLAADREDLPVREGRSGAAAGLRNGASRVQRRARASYLEPVRVRVDPGAAAAERVDAGPGRRSCQMLARRGPGMRAQRRVFRSSAKATRARPRRPSTPPRT